MLTTKTSITVSAPGKLMLSGSYAVVHGAPSVSTAINQRLHLTLSRNEDSVLFLNAPEVGIANYRKPLAQLNQGEIPKGARFIEMACERFNQKHGLHTGVTVETKSDFSAEVGFGSSSAVTAAFVKALFELHDIELDNATLFTYCYEIILAIQGVGSGFDLATAIWGGTIWYRRPTNNQLLEVRKIPVDDKQLNNYFMVGCTGKKADTATLIKMVDAQKEKNPLQIEKIFTEIGAISDKLAQALAASEWQEVGTLLTAHHQLTQQLGVSTPELEALIAAAKHAGAFGAALSGAGGGDCIVAVAPLDKIKSVQTALSEAGHFIPVAMNASGLSIDTN